MAMWVSVSWLDVQGSPKPQKVYWTSLHPEELSRTAGGGAHVESPCVRLATQALLDFAEGRIVLLAACWWEVSQLPTFPRMSPSTVTLPCCRRGLFTSPGYLSESRGLRVSEQVTLWS